MTDFGIVVACDYDEEPGHPSIVEASAVILGSDGHAYICASEKCAAMALDDVGPDVTIHPLHIDPYA